MDKKTILITEHDGTYQLQNDGILEFTLIGILECLLFDLKSASRQSSTAGHQASPTEQIEEPKESEITEDLKTTALEAKREATQLAASPDLRTRISNAIKAIRGLGAQIEDTDLSNLTEEELQSELEELTSQYKRLKNSKGAGK